MYQDVAPQARQGRSSSTFWVHSTGYICAGIADRVYMLEFSTANYKYKTPVVIAK